MRLFKKICNKCGEAALTRIKRNWWMRLIPSCKHYRCNGCGIHFLSFYERVTFQITSPKPKKDEADGNL